MKNRITFRSGDTVQVFRLGTTSNNKIEADKKRKIVQSYTFSRKQFELIASGAKKGMKQFFSIADTNCLDCPFNEFGKCYTHKFNQYVGFISMLKSIAKEAITEPNKIATFDSLPTYSGNIGAQILTMTKGRYVRFGTYGEPSLHPFGLIGSIVSICDTFTGYTHQYKKAAKFAPYFMASTHTVKEEETARKIGFRSFVATSEKLGFVSCPASKEAGYKSTCSKCGLCSGTIGTKSTKSIEIILH